MLFSRLYIHFEQLSLVFSKYTFSYFPILIKGSVFKILIRNTILLEGLSSDTITCFIACFFIHLIAFWYIISLLGSRQLHWVVRNRSALLEGTSIGVLKEGGSVFCSLIVPTTILHGVGIWTINSHYTISHLYTFGSTSDLWQKNNYHSLEEPVRHAPACFHPLNNVSHTNSSSLTRGTRIPLCTPARIPTGLVSRVGVPSQQDVHINERWVSVLLALPCLLLSCSDQQGVCSISETPESARMGYESH